MKKRYTIIFAAAAGALLFASFAVVSPKAVQAAIATLVRDQDNPARHPFSAHCSTTSLGNDETTCSIPVPSGAEYVIQTLAVQAGVVCCPMVTPPTSNLTINATAGGALFQFRYATTFMAYGGGAIWMTTAIPLTVYADPGSNINVSLLTPGTTTAGMNLQVFAQGYYVTLP